MYCVGLTGNIASGKSTAITCFQGLGIPVILADQVARDLVAREQPAFHAILAYFGAEILNTEGQIDRTLLRKIIFLQPEKKLWLEKLLHPLIRQAIKEQVDSCSGDYCVIEIPLLIAKSAYPFLDRILVMFAGRKLQIDRVMQRDQCSREQAIAILATQPSQAQRRQLADDIITNNGSIAYLQKKINKLHLKYLQYAYEKPS